MATICYGCGHPDCGTYCCKHDEFAPHKEEGPDGNDRQGS